MSMAACSPRCDPCMRQKPETRVAIEGDAAFDGQQRFLEIAAMLAEERRLSRLAMLSRRRG